MSAGQGMDGQETGGETALRGMLADFFDKRLDEPGEVRNLRRLTGGSSHETWSFDVGCKPAPNESQGYVLRRELARDVDPQSLVTECALLRALRDYRLPVAEALWCVADAAILGAPSLIMRRVAGVELRKYLAANGDTVDRESLGLALLRAQFAVHEIPSAHLCNILPVPPAASCSHELERWVAIIDAADGRAARPLLAAAVHWLRAHPLPAVGHRLVHGDFKTNNLMLTDNGQATILDWEMAHLGDPVEDLAWTLLWTTPDDLVGGLLSRATYLDAYARLCGHPVAQDRLFYWEMFARVKLAAIFIAGVETTPRDMAVSPLHAMLGRALPMLDRDLARMLSQSQQLRHAQ